VHKCKNDQRVATMRDGALTWARQIALVGATCAACAVMYAQPTAPQTDPARQPIANDPQASVEAYTERLGLEDVLVVQLRDRLRAATDAESRIEVAERLGRVYVRQLSGASTPERRRELQVASRELLELVPEVDSFDLRLDLSKVVYLRAEEIAERTRLRLEMEGEKQQAEKMLRDNLGTFAQLRQRLQRRVEMLDSKESKVDEDVAKLVRAELSEAQRQRSLAGFYEGWSRYYIAMLTGQSAEAKEALEAFGVVLNAVPGRAPSVDRINSGLLQYEHVSRAAVGCALCLSLLGNDVDAIRWLERIDDVEVVPDPVKTQLFSRRLSVLGAAERWADIESLVRRRRGFAREGTAQGLSVAEARLLAVLAFDARTTKLRPGVAAIAQEMGQIALGELIAAKELQQVVDLSQRLGTLPLGDRGFVVAYVRGLLAYDSARGKHREASQADTVATQPELINEYRGAAALFRNALGSADIDEFPSEQSRAQLRLGLALFYAGDLVPAADAFEVAADAIDTTVREDATWFGIVSLDKAIEQGAASQRERRDRLSLLHIQSFPRSPNTARLLLQGHGSGTLSEQQRLEMLLGVPTTSPIYRSARRVAATMLYTRFRSAAPDQRSELARQFLGVAEQVLRDEVDEARATSGEDAKKLADGAVLRARQILDVVLGAERPDADRAEAMLASIERLASTFSLDTRAYASELRLRTLQVALARGDDEATLRLADEMARANDTYATAGARLLFRKFYTQWQDQPTDLKIARRALGMGTRALERDMTSDAALRVRDQVAGLAALLWKEQIDVQMRTLAITLDEELLNAGVQTESVLRRASQVHEDASNPQRACELWSMLMQGVEPKSGVWYEARWNSLRLLASFDAAGAWKVYQQYVALYPDPAPEPWGTRIEIVGNQVKPVPAPVPTQAQPAGKPNGGGR
jgi:tetratricopeptide (TPR) repeat protein